jgi:hypothetical protein
MPVDFLQKQVMRPLPVGLGAAACRRALSRPMFAVCFVPPLLGMIEV